MAVCGALCWPTGPYVSVEGPSANSALFQLTLQRLARRSRRTGLRIILVLDNGSAHVSKSSERVLEEVAFEVRPFWLPTYCSELNAIEILWKLLKQEWFGRMLVKNRRQFDRAVGRVMRLLETTSGLRLVWKSSQSRDLIVNLLMVA